MTMLTREQQLQQWLSNELAMTDLPLHAISGDASFRRYYRVENEQQTWVAVDAPPDHEDSATFISLAAYLADHGILVPQVLAQDLHHGFLLVSDFGDRLLLQELTTDNADHLYHLAIRTLLQIQLCTGDAQQLALPVFDAKIIKRELEQFVSWFLEKELALTLSQSEHSLLDAVSQQLTTIAERQQQVFMHRDFHSRNLMLVNPTELGVVDFQGAMIGPISYDLLSLLRDCYIDWPLYQVEHWVNDYYKQARQLGLIDNKSFEDFLDDFYLLSIQRHLKAIGTFARLHQDEQKSMYLKAIPRTFNYVLDCSQRYAAFQPLHRFLVERVEPLLAIKNYD